MLDARSRTKYVAIAAFVTVLILYFTLYHAIDAVNFIPIPSPPWSKSPSEDSGHSTAPTKSSKIDDKHPISSLINNAYSNFTTRLTKRSWSLEHAAARYRERRGRHPPPGFDTWFEAAKTHDAIIVEDFFDRIHHDINPFWGVDALSMRQHAHALRHGIIRVRNGQIKHFDGDNRDVFRGDRLDLWEKLVRDMLPHLPDLDMPVNLLDEPRMLVPWEDVNSYVDIEQKSRQLFPPGNDIPEQTSFVELDASPQLFDPEWIDDRHKIWNYINSACPPDSPARQVQALDTISDPIDPVFPTGPIKSYTQNGFITNFTKSQDPCLQPHLRGMHGSFVEPFSMSTAKKLFPFFSGSKLPTNNELLIPGAMYLSDQARYTGNNKHGGAWAKKKNGVIWRGTASGGRNQENNWWHYQRHRFVQMLNSSAVSLVENGGSPVGKTFNLEAASMYDVPAQKDGGLGQWIGEWSDVGFNRLDCWPERKDWLGRLRVDCPYTDPYFALAGSVSMGEMYNSKFLPDVDGNSYSARWRPFLLSTSCPLKATVYTEWHDDRLMPWLHFVPFDNTFMDIYAIMDYFLDGHDAQAQRIADEGREWANKVLRKEDMMLYTWRLLLEYARVVDPNRDRLGFVDDLKGRPE
ncbi:lipopolysaccharide-modifying protein [Xylariaceae sp. FL1272]|nr:lipopolysaccharide-modifying protein [Xylariaceae sp. FL1272]